MGRRSRFSATFLFLKRGKYQLNVQILQPRGLGLLQAKFGGMKRKLDAEGLFAPERKRPLPKLPRRIGIVTSPSGAAIRDMLNVLRRRAPWLEVLINPVRVQGTGAAQEIAVAIRELATPSTEFAPVDLIVVARGGGSIEELWEFNGEIVARTIASVNVPVVSAVGHEIDFTICDFVADLRAPTPSAAAELIVPDIVDLRRQIDNCARAVGRELLNLVCATHSSGSITRRKRYAVVSTTRSTVISAACFTLRLRCKHVVLRAKLVLRRNRLVDLRRRFVESPMRRLENARHCFRETEGILRVLGPGKQRSAVATASRPTSVARWSAPSHRSARK